ncbi:tRNA lysidine(34) synthetase TilS [Mesorhizobium sp. BAC0120]|uniref:tRNA lysidine(34) synthetase TilS n=1 Tax=Mesorhizobium sp. BAC0120 TaxID=3090670 RepID=UPI00298CAE31|nr:tRNA lysidine(34) synthetase TilS [Mesorhizobium sp. BAC0120]MDW6021892.1 tRNA lysidine(34) synthetase TilS [Mesorhizobium sp. BAC0120]
MLSAAPGIDPNRIFSDFRLADRDAVIAAVSGGSDSLALLFLLKAFLDAQALTPRLIAVTVDHGLRTESAREAETVAAICGKAGIEHRIARWTGAKPASGVSAAAREARYRLLADAAMLEGTDIILTGHTLDDQIETVAMRAERGDGRGLAGMARATLYGGRVWILRALLGARRAELRQWLGARAVVWIDDPTNIDEKYERARLRGARERPPETSQPASSRASAGGSEGQSGVQDAEQVQSEIVRAAARRIALGERAADLIRAHARVAVPGLVSLDRAFAQASDKRAASYALRMLLAVLGGKEQLPDLARSAALFDHLGQTRHRATLSRTVVDVRRAGVFLYRERRGLPQPMLLGGELNWDGRYRIEAPEQAGQMLLAPFGDDSARRAELPAADAPESLVRLALACQPAVHPVERAASQRMPALLPITTRRREGAATFATRSHASPGEREGEWAAAVAIPILAPWARFLPSFDLAAAGAVAMLLGTEQPPEPPFAGHNARGG